MSTEVPATRLVWRIAGSFLACSENQQHVTYMAVGEVKGSGIPS